MSFAAYQAACDAVVPPAALVGIESPQASSDPPVLTRPYLAWAVRERLPKMSRSDVLRFFEPGTADRYIAWKAKTLFR